MAKGADAIVDLAADPTASTPLQTLKNDVLSDARVQDFLRYLDSKNIALVLSGGGGKGAYEAGALLALFDCGICRFCSMAGTSVGALNAALYHQICRTSDRALLLHIWSNMSFAKVLRPSFGLVFKLLIYWFVSIRAFVKFEAMAENMTSGLDPRLHNVVDLILFATSQIVIVCFIVACGYHAMYASIWLAANIYNNSFSINQPILVVVTTILLIGSIIPLIAGWFGTRLGLFSNEGLRKIMKSIDICSIIRFRPPLACTVTRPVSLLFGRRDRQSPAPVYVKLSGMNSIDEAINLLTQTAAIPEVFRARRLRDCYYVDGGLADNTPILGVANERPEVIIVVYLDHRYRRLSDVQSFESDRLWELCWTMRVEWVGWIARWFANVRLIPIIPSRNLGGLVNGTLNFAPGKARELIGLGYSNVLQQLREESGQAFDEAELTLDVRQGQSPNVRSEPATDA